MLIGSHSKGSQNVYGDNISSKLGYQQNLPWRPDLAKDDEKDLVYSLSIPVHIQSLPDNFDWYILGQFRAYFISV